MKNLLTLFILICCCGNPLFGAIIYWTGAVSSSWNEAGNWDCNCLPGPEDEIFIPQNTGVDLTSGTIATILKLESRGTLYIEDGASLLIDCQQRAGLSGASFIVGELINEGNLIVSHVNGISALLTYPGTHLNNSGIIVVDQVACPLEDNCQLQDAVSFFGTTTNTGTITLRNLTNMDGYSIQANFQNDGQLLGDSLLVSGSAITLNRATTLTNRPSGLIRLTNMQGERLSRGLGNVLDSVSVINEGTLEITFEQSESLGLHLGGTGTRLHNSGTIRIQGARSGLSLYNHANEFINTGEIILSGQSESGLSLKSTQLLAHNEGRIELTDGNSLRALDIGAVSPGPMFLNTGTIRVDQYLQESNSARGIRFLSGNLINRGQIQLIGAGSGTGIEMQANASPLQQPAEGSISIDHFRWGLSHEVASGNAGLLHFGNNLERAIVDNNIPLINTGTLSGGARFDDGTLDLAPNCRIYPGDQYTTGEIIIGHDANLDSSIDVELDLRATPDDPEAYDRITGARSLQYSGVITIKLGEAFALRNGTFTLLKASGSAGGFSGNPTVMLPDPPTGSAWRLEQTSTRLLLHLDLINAVQKRSPTTYKLYPNPVARGGWMQIELQQEDRHAGLVNWFNAQGKLVHQGGLAVDGTCRAPHWLAPGMYYLHWTTASGQAYSRVIVQ